MEHYSVYITQNLIDISKAYVGMTNGHTKNYYGSDSKLRKDIKELGKENFNKTILGTFDNWEECHYWEGFYVRTLKTHISQGGYNKRVDGGAYLDSQYGKDNGMFGRHHNSNTIKLLKTVNHSGEKNSQFGKDHSGEKNGMFGKKHNTNSINKNSESNKNAPNYECEYCGKICHKGNYNRWHGNKCKLNNESK